MYVHILSQRHKQSRISKKPNYFR